jgi:DNA helicase-2/ATP-dependent DNA helicase PcrA
MPVSGRSTKGIAKINVPYYYFAGGRYLYTDKLSDFAIECDRATGGLVLARLARIYTDVFIDEFQDFAGYDLSFVEALLGSEIRLTIVGDPRQHTYSTNQSAKNSGMLGAKVFSLIERWRQAGMCTVETMDGNYRCPQPVCDFANGLWPGLTPMTSLSNKTDDHVGIFLIPEKHVDEYIKAFSPQVLRLDRRFKDYGCESLNFGQAKGLQFPRVLISPCGPVTKFLATGKLDHILKSREKFYVAVTRAELSVGLVHDGSSAIAAHAWPS